MYQPLYWPISTNLLDEAFGKVSLKYQPSIGEVSVNYWLIYVLMHWSTATWRATVERKKERAGERNWGKEYIFVLTNRVGWWQSVESWCTAWHRENRGIHAGVIVCIFAHLHTTLQTEENLFGIYWLQAAKELVKLNTYLKF